MTSPIRREVLRFLIAGAINTTATYAIYLALLPWLQYTLAYTIAFVSGIALAYVLGTWYVFRVRRNVLSLALFPLVYLVQYFAGVLALRVAVDTFAVSPKFALLISIAITIPMTFLLSRWLLRGRRTSGPAVPMERGHE